MQHAAPTALHPELSPLAFLLGRWAGEGQGEYPTISSFRYGEEITFTHVGKAFLAYAQRSWSLDDGRPLHAETGYWRCKPGDRVEAVVSHPTGHVEVAEGSVGQGVVELSSTSMARTSTAKPVEAIVRRLEFFDDHMNYELKMAAVEEPLCVHLRGQLTRVAGPHPGSAR